MFFPISYLMCHRGSLTLAWPYERVYRFPCFWCVQAVNQLCSHFEAYRDIPKITELREKFKNIKQILKSHVFSDFSRCVSFPVIAVLFWKDHWPNIPLKWWKYITVLIFVGLELEGLWEYKILACLFVMFFPFFSFFLSPPSPFSFISSNLLKLLKDAMDSQ